LSLDTLMALIVRLNLHVRRRNKEIFMSIVVYGMVIQSNLGTFDSSLLLTLFQFSTPSAICRAIIILIFIEFTFFYFFT